MNDQNNDTQVHLRAVKLTREVPGGALTAEMSPCVWMNRRYPLQLTVYLKPGSGNAIISDKATGKNYDNATEADMQSLFDKVGVIECKRCKAPAFDPDTVHTNRDRLCETCFMADLNKEFEAAMKKESDKQAKRYAKAKAQGYRFITIMRVHPPQGDDYELELMTEAKPSPEEITKILTRRKSAVLDDFVTKEL